MMRNLISWTAQFGNDESGISSVEYALLLGFVAAGLIFGAQFLSSAVEGEFNDAADTLLARCVQVDSNCEGGKNP